MERIFCPQRQKNPLTRDVQPQLNFPTIGKKQYSVRADFQALEKAGQAFWAERAWVESSPQAA